MTEESEPESALVDELRAVAGADGGNDFTLSWEGLLIQVSYAPGSGSFLSLSVPYDHPQRASEASFRDPLRLHAIRPMKVVLCPERKDHVEAKAAGIDREHQTGDAVFDRRVYIDVPSPEPLPHLFWSDAVRGAVLGLFDRNFQSIVLDDDSGLITARATSFLDLRASTTTPGRDALTAFVRLAKALPPVTARAGEHPADALTGRSRLLFALAGVAFLLGTPMSCLSLGDGCGDDVPASLFFHCMGPGLTGLSAGFAASVVVRLFVRPILTARHGGTSSSSRRIEIFVIALALLVFILVMVIVSTALALASVF
jgi:hypothetical protein